MPYRKKENYMDFEVWDIKYFTISLSTKILLPMEPPGEWFAVKLVSTSCSPLRRGSTQYQYLGEDYFIPMFPRNDTKRSLHLKMHLTAKVVCLIHLESEWLFVRVWMLIDYERGQNTIPTKERRRQLKISSSEITWMIILKQEIHDDGSCSNMIKNMWNKHFITY